MGARQSMRREGFGNGLVGGFDVLCGIFRSAREQRRAESSKLRCLLRGVGDGFWDGPEKQTPGGFAFTGRMPYRSVSGSLMICGYRWEISFAEGFLRK